MICQVSAGRFREIARGFSLVELAISIVVLAGLLYFLLDRVLYMQEMGEKTEVEETIRSINYGLRLEAASRLARGADPSQMPLEKENPIKWLELPPRNYLGEYAKVPAEAKAAYWYFHPVERQLVYKPNRAERLMVEKGTEQKELRFIVRADGSLAQPKLVPKSPYAWFGEQAGEKRQ